MIAARVLAAGLATAIVLWGASASAYEGHPLHPVHEVMTRQAYACLARYDGLRPTSCKTEADAIADKAKIRPFSRFKAEERASGWPDDPAREIGGFSLLRYGWALKFGCGRAATKAGSDYTLEKAGLMCSSHYGVLQYLHAMRSTEKEAYAETRSKMLAWASLTYRLAAGQIDPNISYCQAFAAEAPALARDFAPAGCEHRPLNGQRLSDWTLASLFTLRCKHPFASQRCRVAAREGAGLIAKAAARGALLHLIQDSFSQSHVARGQVSASGFEARIDCTPAAGFLFYDSRSAATHGAADQPPAVAANCGPGSSVDDAVTASAIALWMIDKRLPAQSLVDYLDQRVLGPTA